MIKYLHYILKHKWFVFISYFILIRKYKFNILEHLQNLYLLVLHDISKFSLSEFFQYKEYFYGEYGVRFLGGMFWEWKEHEKTVLNFNKAWLHHQKKNPHHWQYWMLQNDNGNLTLIQMPKKYVIEMVCDWIGAGWAIKGKIDVHNWYYKNKENIKLNPLTQEEVEKIIEVINETT